MSAQRDFSVLWERVHHGLSHLPSMKVLSATALLILGAGLIFVLPENADSEPRTASATAPMPETTGSADESLCDKQAWPYVDQRCAQRVEAARGMRQVRIVTDKGHSVKTMTPQPIVEPKPKLAPAPAVAQAEKPIGPPVAPTVEAPPQTEKFFAASQQPAPAPQNSPAPKAAPAPAVQTATAPTNSSPAAVARDNSAPSGNAGTAPAAASAAPGINAFADSPRGKKSRAERAAEKAQKAFEKAEKRETKRRRSIELDEGSAPEDVVATVKSQPGGGPKSGRGRNAVPDEVLAAVEEAVANERGGRTVTVEAERGGQRVYVVPREDRW